MLANPTIEQLYDLFSLSTGVNTDTRTIEIDQLFVALKGANFNGNQYAEEALQKGALYAVVDEKKYATSEQHILVNDGLQALQQLAAFHRDMLTIPVIGITGSNGKTTTKELIASVLSTSLHCYCTQGNLNNHIGVPLSVLNITPQHDIAVIEMGANHVGEIAELCLLCKPNYGLITNIGVAHIEGFGSKENVKKGKGELYDFLRTTEEKTVFINADDHVLQEMATNLEKVEYGTGGIIQGEIQTAHPQLRVRIEDEDQYFMVQTKLVGEYNLPNILAATAVGRYFDIPLLDIAEAIEDYTPSNHRSQLVEQHGHEYIVDAYNANPSSMYEAIKSLSMRESEHKVAILGHMLELGDVSDDEHFQIAEFAKTQIDLVLLVGNQFEAAGKSHSLPWVATATEAKEWIAKTVNTPSTILIKGSRGIKLEKVLG